MRLCIIIKVDVYILYMYSPNIHHVHVYTHQIKFMYLDYFHRMCNDMKVPCHF